MTESPWIMITNIALLVRPFYVDMFEVQVSRRLSSRNCRDPNLLFLSQCFKLVLCLPRLFILHVFLQNYSHVSKWWLFENPD